MDYASKTLALTLILLMTLSSLTLLTAKPASAQKNTPSIPEFSLEYVNTTYFSSPTTTTNPYTGQNQSYSIPITERGIIITIKNQPFTQPIDNNSLLDINEPCLFYLFQWKGYYSSTWTNSSQYRVYSDQQSNCTVIRLGMDGNNDNSFGAPIQLEDIPDGGKLDFQVQAFIGYYIYVPTPTQLNPFYPTSTAVFVGQSSGWSNTQTLTIINGSKTTSISADTVSDQPSNLSPTAFSQEPKQDSFPITLIIGLAIVIVFVIFGLLLYRLHRKYVFSFLMKILVIP